MFGAPHRTPSSRATIATGAFVSLLDVTDPRFDVFCYGPFIKELPKRLGHNSALDASAAAFASAIRVVRTKQRTVDALRKYGAALNAVQQSLADPVSAYSAETLCSIYLIMVVHPWLASQGDRYPNHGEGMAQLLNNLVNKTSQDEFLRTVITTVGIAVVSGILTSTLGLPILSNYLRIDPRSGLQPINKIGLVGKSQNIQHRVGEARGRSGEAGRQLPLADLGQTRHDPRVGPKSETESTRDQRVI